MSEPWREVIARALLLRLKVNAKRWPAGRTVTLDALAAEYADVALSALAEAGPDETMIEAARLAEMKHEATPREELLLTDPSLRTWVYERSRAGLTAALRSATQEGNDE